MTGAGLLEPLFCPRQVAVYGASARDPSKLGNTLLRNVGAAGAVAALAVHPSAATVEGVAAVPGLAASGRGADLALISVPAAGVERAVADAASGGARVAVVLSSGFGETDVSGRAHELRLRAVALEGGMRLVGPNCMGVVSSLSGGRWLNGSYFWSPPDRAGSLAFVSQSGAFGGIFFAECRARRLGVSRFVSVGNAADVTEIDVLEALAADDATTAVGLFVEGFRDGRRFIEVARRVAADKPVVVLKAGKAAVGARAAASHTGSIAGTHGPARAAFARARVVEAATSDDFFDALAAVHSDGTRRGRRVAIVTVSGGPAVLAADAADAAGLELPAPAAATVRVVGEHAPAFAALGNPIDLTPQCPPAGFGPSVAAIYDDEGFDAVLVIDCGLDVPELGASVVAAAHRTGKATAAFVLDVPRVRDVLAEAAIPCFSSPERAARALATRVA